MDLVSLLVFLLILGLVYWCAHRLISAFGLPAPIAVVVDVLLVIIAILWLLNWAGVGGVPSLRLGR